ncbi:uncharacterized protein LOC119128852 isoform X1 [Syngnathus acus]|uniref:uncharacterized protein LOC119128852 isoform X1 n=1 Tax=Syngnathus acus TaxID=161584 RepID=UPI001886294D|nr:uncharacterized protein LOC119128852 isoform X1 [Syngnathus acus]
MRWSIVTKLLILAIFIVIICLPDFFTSYTVSKVNLVCLPCERDKRAKKRENWQSVEAEVKRKMSCDPPPIPGDEEWRERCDEREADSGPTSDDASSEEPHTSWYMCESQGSVAELYHNNSFSAANVHIEVSVKLQLGNSTFLKLTLSGHRNSSSLRLQPPEETDDGGCSVASYCCALVPPTSETSNHTVCLLRLSNYTVSPVAEKELVKTQGPDEWSAVLRILWLVLLCVVLLTLSSAFLRKLKRSGHCCKKVHPLGYSFTGQQLKDGSNDKIKILKERNLHMCELRSTWSGLSTIQEVQVADDAETVLDGPVEDSYVTANLHHRPTVTFSLTEELSC